MKAVNATTERLFSERWICGEVVLNSAPGRAMPDAADAERGLQQIQQADIVVYDRLVLRRHYELVHRGTDRGLCGETRGLPLRPHGKKSTRSCCIEAQKVNAWYA